MSLMSSRSSSSDEYHHPPSSAGSSGIDWAYCGSFFIWVLAQWWDLTLACLELWWHLMTASHLSTTSLYRLSIVMLAWHYMSEMLSTVLVEQEQSGLQVLMSVLVSDAWWLWALPLVTGCITVMVAIPYLIRMPSAFHQGAIMTALVSLFMLEAMIPIVLLVCTSLCLLQKISWGTGLLVLGTVWTSVTISAHWIRCLVYQNMGQG